LPMKHYALLLALFIHRQRFSQLSAILTLPLTHQMTISRTRS
jgi:hypothetical protein